MKLYKLTKNIINLSINLIIKNLNFKYYSIYSRHDFRKYYLETSLDNLLFTTLDKIINTDKIFLKNKQRRLEKLLNVYYLKKSEFKYELNPFWWNQIEKVFLSEFLTFNVTYENMLVTDIKTNLFNKIKLTSFFISKEVFSLIIYNYLSLLDNSDTIPKTSTLISNLVDSLWTFNLPKLENYYLFEFIELNLKSKYNLSLYSLYTLEDLNSLSHWKVLLLNYFCKLKDLNIVVESNSKKEIENSFLNYFSTQEETIKIFIYKIAYQSYYILLDLNIFEKHIEYKNKKKYDYSDVFNLEKFNHLSTMCYLNNNLPMLHPPLNWNYKGESGGYLLNKKNKYMSLVKNLVNGKSSLSYSHYLIDTVNMIQQKCYWIDKDYYNYIMSDLFKLEAEIPLFEDLYNKYESYWFSKQNYLEFLKTNNYDSNIIYIYKVELNHLYLSDAYKLSTSEERTKLFEQLKKDLRITNELLNFFSEQKELKRIFHINLNKYKNHNYIEKITKFYLNRKFYIVNRLDFRTRQIPVSRCLHRATGIYKYMLIDKQFRFSYDSNTIKCLKQFCYLQFIGSTLLTYTKLELELSFDNLINPFLLDLKSTQADLLNFLKLKDNLNECNYKNKNLYNLILKSKNKMLFLFGLIDYITFLIQPYSISYFLIDFDQCSSGPMIYSLLSQDTKMGNLTNALPLNPSQHQDLYIHFLESFYLALESCNSPELSELNFNKKSIFSRDFSKLIIMPTFYNMGSEGLRNLLISYLKDFNENTLNITKMLSLLIPIIQDLLHKNYTHTILFQENLVTICKLLFSSNEWITIRTLDSSVIKYKYLEKLEKFGKIYRNNTTLSYRLYLNNIFSNQLSVQQKISFPPNYIHSIDGSLCRIICNIFYKLTGLILEPLHDSFRLSFPYIKYLSSIIKYVYIFYFFNEYFHKHKIYFDPNVKWELTFNNINYLKYKDLFPDNNFNGNLVNFTFFEALKVNININLYNTIYNSINQNIMFPTVTEDNFFKFFNSEFTFYY